jgi:hypothetical protein
VYLRPKFLHLAGKIPDDPCFEIPACVPLPAYGLPSHLSQPEDLPNQATAMPAHPEMHSNLLPVSEIQVLHLIGLDEFRDLAAVHYVN